MSVLVREINGKWYVQVNWHGRRKSKQMTSEARAIEVAEKVRMALDLYGLDAFRMLQKPVPASRIPSVKTFGIRWLQEKERQVRRSSWRSLDGNLRRNVFPVIGDRGLDEVGYADVKRMISRLQDEHKSRSSIRIAVSALYGLFREAVREKLVATNPVVDTDRLYRTAPGKEPIDPFTIDEIHAIEELCRQRYGDWYPFVMMLTRTGMRIGEARGLRWRDFDWRARQIMVERNIPSTEQRETWPTKTPSGRRLVDMSPDLHAVMDEHRKQYLVRCLAAGREPNEDDPVFMTSAWTPVHYTAFLNRVWRPLMRKSGIRYRTPHDLRHSWASILLSKGEDLAYVSKQLGHSSPAVTLEIYTHYVRGSRRAGAAVLDRKSANGTQMEAAAANGSKAND